MRWIDCEWLSDVSFARETRSGLLTAFVAVNIRFEAVEDDIGAELPHATDVLGPTRHRQHARPEQTGDLNGRGGDPTRCSRNEQRLAILEPTPGLQRPPGRLVRQGCGSRDSKFQVIRDPVEIPRRDPNPFRGPAGHVLPEDLEVQA